MRYFFLNKCLVQRSQQQILNFQDFLQIIFFRTKKSLHTVVKLVFKRFINILELVLDPVKKNRYCLIGIVIWYYKITKALYLFSSRIMNSNQKSTTFYSSISLFWFLALLIRKIIHICHIWLKYKSIPDWECNK